MSLELEIVNPLDYPRWDELLLAHPEYSFFHSSHWARVLHDSYHYKPLYFTLVRQGKLSVMAPVMEVKSFLTGTRGVSLPFTDYCEPIIFKKSTFPDVMSHLIRFGKKAGWGSFEMRSANGVLQDVPCSSFYYGHTLDLSPGEERLASNFRDSTRRNIKKAMREAIQVSLSHSSEAVAEFYRLQCVTRKEHGLPPQPYYFFKNIYDHIISKNLGFVVLASQNGRNIAGAVYFHSREKTIYKYGASIKRYQHLRANNLVMWEAIKWCSQNGYKCFCFGRTEPENDGLRQFKTGWGAEENVIRYVKYDIGKKKFIMNNGHATGFPSKIFRQMPIPLLRLTGALLYKHMG